MHRFLSVMKHYRSRGSRRALSIASAAATMACAAGCQWPATTGLPIWAAEPEQQIFPESPSQADNEIFSQSRASIALAGAVNETLSFQLVVPGREVADAVSSIGMTSLVGRDAAIPDENTAIYRIACISVGSYPAWFYQRTPYRRETREFPDVLIPVTAGSTALPAQLTPGRNTVFWVEVRIPPGVAAGEYTGHIEVVTRGQASARLKIELEVWPFALPEMSHVTALAALQWRALVAHHLQRDGSPYRPARLAADDPNRPAALAVLDAAFQLLRRHRCHGLLTDYPVLRQTTPDGRLQLEWADFDTVATAYLDGSAFEDRIPLPVWRLPMDESEPVPTWYGGVGSPRYENAVREMADACLSHAEQRGWLDRHFVLLSGGRPSTGDEYARYEAVARVFHAVEPRLRLWCDLPPQSMTAFGWWGHAFRDLGNLVGVWCPSAGFADPSVFPSLRRAGARIWWQPDRPPYSGSLALVSPPVDVRCIAWQASRWAGDAVWLGNAADWPAQPPASRETVPPATAETSWLIYPGRSFGLNGPIPSIRLKHLRAGLQDAEYLWLLRQQGRLAVADLVAQALFAFGGAGAYGEHYLDGRAGGWTRDPAMWRLGRQLLAMELKRAASGEPAESFEESRQRLEWQRFLLGTRRLSGWSDGVRIRSETAAGPRAVQAEASLSLLNQTSHPVRAVVECGAVPAGWKAESPMPGMDVPPGQMAKRRVTFRTSAIDFEATGGTGVLSLPLALSTASGGPVEARARVAAIKGLRVQRPILIDGDLSDWPPGFGNVAGDFVLLGGQDVPKTGPGRPDRPILGTTVFVCFDSDSLYIGFLCEDDRLDQREIAHTNYVRYEGMAPVGEDLVEILFDPGEAATGPGDLYHLVVKANGGVIAERGIGCRPPIGPHRPWTAEAQVGVGARSAAGRWFVEVRIPWASFGSEARQVAWWGINFARLHSRSGDYSTWSGARWNAYTPATLGNLFVGWDDPGSR